MTTKQQDAFARSINWAASRERDLRAANRLAWCAAGVAALVAVAEALALTALAPLKSVTAIPVLVDRQTGYVQTLKPDGRAEIRADAALTQSLLEQYVVAREGFNIASVASEYRRAMLWSAETAQTDYAALMQKQNPQSPLRLYPRSTRVEAVVSSISPLSPQVSLVRFSTVRKDGDIPSSAVRHWAAVVTYRYVDTPMKLEDRLTNPLGFQVIRYHKDEESPPSTPDPAPPSRSLNGAAAPEPAPTTAMETGR